MSAGEKNFPYWRQLPPWLFELVMDSSQSEKLIFPYQDEGGQWRDLETKELLYPGMEVDPLPPYVRQLANSVGVGISEPSQLAAPEARRVYIADINHCTNPARQTRAADALDKKPLKKHTPIFTSRPRQRG